MPLAWAGSGSLVARRGRGHFWGVSCLGPVSGGLGLGFVGGVPWLCLCAWGLAQSCLAVVFPAWVSVPRLPRFFSFGSRDPCWSSLCFFAEGWPWMVCQACFCRPLLPGFWLCIGPRCSTLFCSRPCVSLPLVSGWAQILVRASGCLSLPVRSLVLGSTALAWGCHGLVFASALSIR